MKQLLSATLLFLYCINASSQNVGIGNATPASKLEINNNSSLRASLGIVDSTANGLGTIRLKNSVRTNRYMELEGLTFSNFARDNYLDIKTDSSILATFRGNGNLGIGTVSPSERLHVNGNMNITGNIKLNGNAGTAGQVLTSNGAGAAEWRTAGYAAGGRLMVPAVRTPIPFKLERNLRLGDPVYNTFGAAITVLDSSIVFNETGLYELEGKIMFLPGNVTVDQGPATATPMGTMRILVNTGVGVPTSFLQIEKPIAIASSFSAVQGSFRELIPFRFVTHITAGTVLTFPVNISNYNGDVCCDFVNIFESSYIGVLKLD